MKRRFALMAPAMFNWSETRRMIEIAIALKERGYRVAFLGDGRYASFLNEEDFERYYLDCDKVWFTEERKKKMLDIDRYGNDYASASEIYSVVVSEVNLIKEIKPDIIVTGYRTTMSISARVAEIPLVWFLSAVTAPIYFRSGLASFPDNMDVHIFLKDFKSEQIKQEYKKKFMDRLIFKNPAKSKEWNRVLKAFNLPPFESDLDIFKGDLNCMTDAMELFPESFQNEPNYKFCGPIFPKENLQMPECVKEVTKNGKKSILVVMGSSGHRDVFLKILESLKKLDDINIFVAKVGIISEEDEKSFPVNFYFCDAFPLTDALECMDGCIMHGGQGTLYSTILSGKPFVGIPMFNEQQYNLENLCRYGCGIIIHQRDLTEGVLCQSVKNILSDVTFSNNMLSVRNKISRYFTDDKYKASNVAADYITDFLNNRS